MIFLYEIYVIVLEFYVIGWESYAGKGRKQGGNFYRSKHFLVANLSNKANLFK